MKGYISGFPLFTYLRAWGITWTDVFRTLDSFPVNPLSWRAGNFGSVCLWLWQTVSILSVCSDGEVNLPKFICFTLWRKPRWPLHPTGRTHTHTRSLPLPQWCCHVVRVNLYGLDWQFGLSVVCWGGVVAPRTALSNTPTHTHNFVLSPPWLRIYIHAHAHIVILLYSCKVLKGSEGCYNQTLLWTLTEQLSVTDRSSSTQSFLELRISVIIESCQAPNFTLILSCFNVFWEKRLLV